MCVCVCVYVKVVFISVFENGYRDVHATIMEISIKHTCKYMYTRSKYTMYIYLYWR